ncbi:MAG: ABC transporter substrate-binding protein [Spirochaetales bacterium]|uniref:ABC transporter substrate-binding protein n=1 Tax=Candidatus Thalassospirochaeta sargassi TaxID=3119039 RepID=A0AAJ1IID6_9SPIO|nr:ABC transporter substrate-binding protein [Spirochaetales bacterium]
MKKGFKFYVVALAIILVFGNVLAATAEGQQEASNPEEYKLGFMSSLSGIFAAVAETQKMGMILAADEFNAKGGLDMPWGKVPVTYEVKDAEAKLDVGVRRFRELQEAGINGFTGTAWNPISAAINEEMKMNPLPYLAANVPALDSFRKGNPAIGTYSVAFTPWSIGYLSGGAAIEKLGAKKIFWVSRADSWGATQFEGLEAAIEELGGEVVGFAEYPKGTVDFTAAINKALEVKPDVFMACQFGGDAIALFKQAYDMGLHEESMLFNTWTTNLVAKGIPSDALKNLYALDFYYWNMEGFEDQALADAAVKFTEAHRERWGEAPDAYGAIAYMAAKILFEAVEEAGSFATEDVAAVLDTKTFDTIKGPMSFREDHELLGDYLAFIVKGKAPEEMSSDDDFWHVEGYFGGDSAMPSLESLGY